MYSVLITIKNERGFFSSSIILCIWLDLFLVDFALQKHIEIEKVI